MAAEAGVHGPSLIKRPDGHLDRPDGPTDRFARDTPPIRMVRGRPDINGIKVSIPSQLYESPTLVQDDDFFTMVLLPSGWIHAVIHASRTFFPISALSTAGEVRPRS